MTPVLACFVVLGTATAIYLLRQDDPAPRADAPAEEEIVEIAPALPAISLLPSSVPEDAGDPEESTSLLEGYEWHDERERNRRFARSLKEAVGDIHGLGVYVAPPGNESPKEDDR